MPTLFALILSLAPQSNDLQRLEHLDPEIRLLAVKLVGRERTATAVARLIGRLEDSAETPEIKAEAQKSLERITGRAEKDAAAWRAWWNSEGSLRFSEAPLAPDELSRWIQKTVTDSERRVEAAKKEVRSVAITLAVAIFLFIIVMFFFVGHVSSKIKGWRELVGRAEIYIKHSQELTERTDKIAAEIEGKKAEAAGFLEKLRKEQEEGIARRGDELGADLAHQLRMELQTLRQKAERELAQTVTDLKTQIESTARRAAAEVRDRLPK